MHVKKAKEKGQVLVIVTLLIVAFIAMLALVLDGGLAYTARRRAQNAADAGALAGANTLCRTSNATEAQTVALDYAVTRNKATNAIALANVASGTVAVTTTVQVDNFFAWIFGNDQTNAGATARAGCYPVCEATGVLPIAWACKPPAGQESSKVCSKDPNQIYIVMDNFDTNEDFFCKDPDPTSPTYGEPANALDCDVDNDGFNDVLPGGDRSWLNLDGNLGGETVDVDWITSGNSPLISAYTWVGGSVGARANTFQAVRDYRVGDIVTVPVFNRYCDPSVEAANCPGATAEELADPVVGDGNSLYFHIIALSAFKITGVCDGSNDPTCANKCTGDCSGYTAMRYANPDGHFTNMKSIEGYFLNDYVPGMVRCTGDSSYYTGAFVVHLKP